MFHSKWYATEAEADVQLRRLFDAGNESQWKEPKDGGWLVHWSF